MSAHQYWTQLTNMSSCQFWSSMIVIWEKKNLQLFWLPLHSEEAKLSHALRNITRRHFLPITKGFSNRDLTVLDTHWTCNISTANLWESHIIKMWSMKHLAWINFASSLCLYRTLSDKKTTHVFNRNFQCAHFHNLAKKDHNQILFNNITQKNALDWW